MAAFTNFFFIVLLVLGALLSAVFNEVSNYIVTFINIFISAGEVSVEFTWWFGFVIGILRAAPFLLLFSIAIWAIVRANEKRQARF